MNYILLAPDGTTYIGDFQTIAYKLARFDLPNRRATCMGRTFWYTNEWSHQEMLRDASIAIIDFVVKSARYTLYKKVDL